MAPPLKVKSTETKQQGSHLRPKEDPSQNVRNARRKSMDLKQPNRPSSMQKYPSKSSSLLNVSRIKRSVEKRGNTSESEIEETHYKACIPKGKRMTRNISDIKILKTRDKSQENIDSGCSVSRRGSFTSHLSSDSNSMSCSSDDTQGSTEKKNEAKDNLNKIGFGNLPGQIYKKAVRKGFEFSLMVVGESGLGKSTLVNSMFLEDI